MALNDRRREAPSPAEDAKAAGTRRAILDAARELFLTQDHRGVSARKVADRAGYSPMIVYRHFKDMRDLLVHLIEEGYGMLVEALERIGATDPIEWLVGAGAAFVEFGLANPTYYRLMFQIEDQALTDAAVARGEMQERAYQLLRGRIEEGIASGRIQLAANPDTVAYVLLSAVHGATSFALTGRLKRLPPAAQAEFLDVLIRVGLSTLTRRPDA
jgi:AcrR family transcriptional regulator